MALPGFSAETSLYRTSVHYRLTGVLVQADEIVAPTDLLWAVLQRRHGGMPAEL